MGVEPLERRCYLVYRSRDISTSGLVAAIFKSRLPVTSVSICNSSTELLDPEIGGLAFGTDLISGIEAEI